MKRTSFYLAKNSDIESLKAPENSELIDLLRKSCHEQMKTYFGNGKNAKRGELKRLTANVNGKKIEAVANIIIYSYRWHKLVWSYFIDNTKVTRHKLFNL